MRSREATDELESATTVVCTKMNDDGRTRWTVRIQASDLERPVIVRGATTDDIDVVLDLAADELRRRRQVAAVA